MMRIFTFYPCQEDGSGASFEAFELTDETEAPAKAAQMLLDHPSCCYVTVWDADHKVLRLDRGGLPESARRTGA